MPRFSKYSGAGNDFVLVRAEEVGLGNLPGLARRICGRVSGVGVDGLILVRSLSDEHVRIRFFNPDGSEFGTCGNGSRCAARYAVERGLVPEPVLQLVTDDGEIMARVEGAAVSLDFHLDAVVEREIPVDVDGSPRAGWVVQIGTPHIVVPLDSIEVSDFDDVCRAIRSDPTLGEGGANVDLVTITGPDSVAIRTFERGVEGETLACGSGAMATALALHRAGRTGDRLTLETRSGAILGVELHDGGFLIWISGPALHIFDGVFPDAAD
jgi:diaminopimelate epimerase